MSYVKNVNSQIILLVIGIDSVSIKRFQDFKNWTSGNSDDDKLIQQSQLNAKFK